MQVICEIMRLKPEYVKEYINIHNKPWPGLVKAIRESGFLEEYIYIFGNLVIVIMKCENFDESRKRLITYDVFKKWTTKVQSMLIEDKETFPINGKLIDLDPIWSLDNYK